MGKHSGEGSEAGSSRCVSASAVVRLLLAHVMVAELLTGSACLSPQVVKDVQTAEPLSKNTTKTTVSGGITWPITGVTTFGIPSNPNADLNLLVRHAYEEDKELQVPINLSVRLGPGFGDEQWLGIHIGSGLFWKRSKLLAQALETSPSIRSSETESDSKETFATRPIYKAWVLGPSVGVLFTAPESSLFVNLSGEDFGYFYPVSPFAGLYFKYINERRKNRSVCLDKKGKWTIQSYRIPKIRVRGFLASVNVFPLDYTDRDSFNIGELYIRGIELFMGGFVGGDHKSWLSQFTYGISMHRSYGLKFIIGTTFGSTGK